MSKNITVPDDLYSRLHAQAVAHGETLEIYLERLASAENSQDEKLRERLRAKGLLVTFLDPLPEIVDCRPVAVQGAPVSQTIIEDRR